MSVTVSVGDRFQDRRVKVTRRVGSVYAVSGGFAFLTWSTGASTRISIQRLTNRSLYTKIGV